MSVAISAVVNTLDAERFLAYALRSLAPWVDEIVVVDMGSRDATVAIAERLGARVVAHPPTGFVEGARAFACAQARAAWVFVLDADELVPAPLARRLRGIAERDEADVVRIARVNHLLGAPLLHSGWNPDRDRHVRFFKRGMVDIPALLHTDPRPIAAARALSLPATDDAALVHLNYLDVDEFVARANRYAGVEAAQTFARGGRATGRGALGGAAREWLVRFVRHRGYRDGWRGFYLSLLMAFARIVTQAKLAELEAVGSRELVLRRYCDTAERVLADYEGRS